MVLLALGQVVQGAGTYTLVDLGPGVAKDINSLGKVVGNSTAGGWLFDGAIRTDLTIPARYLGAPPEQLFTLPASSANAISDNGVIVGHLTFPTPLGTTLTPYVYPPGGVATLVGLGIGAGVNAAGTAVGGAGNGAFVFDGSAVTPLTTPDSRPLGINAGGLVVGSAAPDGPGQAVFFEGGAARLLDLSGVGLPAPVGGGYYSSEVRGVNAAGMMIGTVAYDSGSPLPKPAYAFLFVNGAAANLGVLGGSLAAANDVNADGVIVGSSTMADATPHAFVYSGGTMSDLNGRLASGGTGWILLSANAINDSGMIVGEGTVGGVTHAFLLKPSSAGLPPSIVFQPKRASVFVGEPLTLSVTASGTPPIAYQWKHGGTNLPAATARTYTVDHATEGDAGGYRVLVSNGAGSLASDEVQVEVKVLAELGIATYAGLQVNGPVGKTFRIEAVERLGDTNWQLLATVVLDASPVFWLDRTTPIHLSRIYRAVPVP